MAVKEKKRKFITRLVCIILAFLMAGTTVLAVMFAIIDMFKG